MSGFIWFIGFPWFAWFAGSFWSVFACFYFHPQPSSIESVTVLFYENPVILTVLVLLYAWVDPLWVSEMQVPYFLDKMLFFTLILVTLYSEQPFGCPGSNLSIISNPSGLDGTDTSSKRCSGHFSLQWYLDSYLSLLTQLHRSHWVWWTNGDIFNIDLKYTTSSTL